ncbi:MAG: hypothetical protein GX589_02010, partial [Deltaproteobacteria bacterium]|nr:hypothetical protein [Deltaproteobacteria bacterium]
GCGLPGPSGCDNQCGSTKVVDCAGVCGGSAVDLGCGCNLPGPSGCDNKCGSTKVVDCAGVCGGTAKDLGCGCNLPGPSGCDNKCGSTLKEDRCGVCGGDGSSCLGCKTVDQRSQYDKIKTSLRREVKLIKRNLEKSKLTASFKKKVLRQARKNFKAALAAVENLPASVTNCASVEFCVSVDVSSVSLKKVLELSKKQVKLNRKAMRKGKPTVTGEPCKGSIKECEANMKARTKRYIESITVVRKKDAKVQKTAKNVDRFTSKCS